MSANKKSKMKLSEAILKGSEGKNQHFGDFAKPKSEGNNAYCALGAAFKASGFSQAKLEVADVPMARDYYPMCDLRKSSIVIECPERCSREFTDDIGDFVIHLNDKHRMSFKRIAAHVKKMEDKIQKELANAGK